MKISTFLCSVLLIFIGCNLKAQTISEDRISFMDGKQDAVVAKYQYSEDVMEAAIDKVLAEKKIKKTKNTKGFRLYQGVIFDDLCRDVIDLYIKIDGNKKETTVTILISKGYNNFISSSNDGNTIKNTKNLCKVFNVSAIEEYLNREIEKQEEIVKEADKKQKKSVEHGKDLVKDKEELLKKIDENIEEQKQLKAALEEQIRVLNNLKSKK